MEVKQDYERRHGRDQFDSLMGPTHDKVNYCLRPNEVANRTTNTEYNAEKTMGMKTRIKNLYD